MSLLLVIDTNVIASTTISPLGPPALILKAAQQGSVRLALCPQILDEVAITLTKPFFQEKRRY